MPERWDGDPLGSLKTTIARAMHEITWTRHLRPSDPEWHHQFRWWQTILAADVIAPAIDKLAGQEGDGEIEALRAEVAEIHAEIAALATAYQGYAEDNMDKQNRCVAEGHANAIYYEAKVECYGVGAARLRHLADRLAALNTTPDPEDK